MRKPLLSLAAVALVATACSSSSSTSAPSGRSDPQAYAPSAAASAAAPGHPRATPYDGVTYQDHGVNPFVDPREDRVSTFALDVDTASYAIAQRYIEDGNRPDPASVRVEEWVNAFDQGYRAARRRRVRDLRRRRPDAVHRAGRGPRPDRPPGPRGARPRSARTRRSRSSSTRPARWSATDRLELVKDALRILVDELGPDDRVAVVTFGSDARLVLESTPADDRRRHPARDRPAPAGRLDQPRGRPPARLRAGPPVADRERHRPRRRSPRTASPTSGSPTPTGSCAASATTPRTASSSSASASGWATTTTPSSSSWPTRATASTPT